MIPILCRLSTMTPSCSYNTLSGFHNWVVSIFFQWMDWFVSHDTHVTMSAYAPSQREESCTCQEMKRSTSRRWPRLINPSDSTLLCFSSVKMHAKALSPGSFRYAELSLANFPHLLYLLEHHAVGSNKPNMLVVTVVASLLHFVACLCLFFQVGS